MSSLAPPRSSPRFCPRVVFFGSGFFARPILSSLLELSASANCELCLIITQDKLQAVGLQPEDATTSIPPLRSPRFDEELYVRLAELRADLFITASYGFRFPREYLDLAAYGSYNLHASLLPRWRGSSPIQHSILHGDATSGVTLIRMDEGIDCGGIIRQTSLAIGSDDSQHDLESRLAELGARALGSFLTSGDWRDKPLGVKQDDGAASYARKLRRGDGLLDWRLDAEFLSRQVRAFSPWPGTFFTVADKRILLHAARVEEAIDTSSDVSGGDISGDISGKVSGKISDEISGEILRLQPYPLIRCGGVNELSLLSLQREGGRICAAADFLRGFPLRVGMTLGGKD